MPVRGCLRLNLRGFAFYADANRPKDTKYYLLVG